jgi:hypothetical protein
LAAEPSGWRTLPVARRSYAGTGGKDNGGLSAGSIRHAR